MSRCLLEAEMQGIRSDSDTNPNGHIHSFELTATNQLPGSPPGAGVMVEDAPGEKSADAGPHTTSLSFVPFTRTDFPSKEQLRWSNEKSSNH